MKELKCFLNSLTVEAQEITRIPKDFHYENSFEEYLGRVVKIPVQLDGSKRDCQLLLHY